MGIALSLIGTPEDPARCLTDAARWLAARTCDPAIHVVEDSGVVFAEVHPAAEAIELTMNGGSLHLRAKTATCGPAYHLYVSELARALGDAIEIRWSDDENDEVNELFFRPDDALLEECFLDWLGAVCAQVLELVDQGASQFALSLPAGAHFEHDGAIATPLGPRDAAWLRAVVDDPRAGIDVFPWWHRDEARRLRGLAVCEMWTNVRWRAPIEEREGALLDRIATWIEKAHALDPELELPWREQSEILTLLSEQSLRATRAHLKADSDTARRAPIGYRRRPVRVELSGGWSLRLPGELAEKWDERGTWLGWDARRSIWFNSLTMRTERGDPSPSTEATLASLAMPEGDELLELSRGELRGVAAFIEEEGTLRLEAVAASGPHAALGTIVVDPSDREFALETWGSLRR
jgi:hypothetical protein